MSRLYVGNLPQQTTEQDLQMWIESHGFKVEAVQVIKDLDTGTSRGFGFAELPEILDAREAVSALNGQEMEGQNLRVSEARPLQFKTEGRQQQPTGARMPKKRAS